MRTSHIARECRRWVAVIFAGLVTACGGVSAEPAKGTDRKAPDDMAAKGYTTIPLRHPSADTLFLVEVTAGKEKLTLYVDTGASATTISPKAAKRLKLTTEPLPDPPKHLFIGQRPLERGVIENLTAGGLQFPPYRVHVGDLEGLFHPDDLATTDGILGSDILSFFSAVIDYSEPALHLIPPQKLFWPKLKGVWEMTSRQAEGETIQASPTGDHARIEFTDEHRFTSRHTLGQVSKAFDGNMRLAKVGLQNIYATVPEKDQETSADAVVRFGIFAVDGDVLKMVTVNEIKMDESDFAKLPKAFEAKQGSGHVLYTFKRVKAEKK